MTSASKPSSALLHYVRATALRLALVLGTLFLLQDKLILRPEFGGEGGKTYVSRAGWSASWRENGEFLGKVYEPDGAAKGTIVVYHGNAGTVDNRETLAQVLTQHGFRAVLVEYPGFGERAGWATVGNALAAALEGFERAKLKWPGPTYVLGESIGAGMAAQVANRYPDQVEGVLLFTPWDSLFNVVNKKFFHIPVGYLLRQKLDSGQALSSYKGNIGIVAAGADTLIPTEHARALAKALPAAVYTELPGAGHNTWFSSLSRKDWDALFEGLTKE